MTKQDAKNSIQQNDEVLEQTNFTDEEIENMIHEEQQAEFEKIDINDDYSEPYSEYGEEYEEEPLFEKTNRQKGVRKVRD